MLEWFRSTIIEYTRALRPARVVVLGGFADSDRVVAARQRRPNDSPFHSSSPPPSVNSAGAPQQRLYFNPDKQGHSLFRGTLMEVYWPRSLRGIRIAHGPFPGVRFVAVERFIP